MPRSRYAARVFRQASIPSLIAEHSVLISKKMNTIPTVRSAIFKYPCVSAASFGGHRRSLSSDRGPNRERCISGPCPYFQCTLARQTDNRCLFEVPVPPHPAW